MRRIDMQKRKITKTCIGLSEKDIQKQIEDYLRKRGWMVMPEPHVQRKPGHNFVGTKGRADILALKNGQYVAIEVKTATGKPTDEQWAFLENVNTHGGCGYVVRSLEGIVGLL
jgi:hypothetical protein